MDLNQTPRPVPQGGSQVPTPGPPDGKAHDTALELLKQLITLSSGVLALSATFVDKLWPRELWLQVVLGTAWLLLILSTISALQAISSLVQVLRKPDFTWSADAVRRWARGAKWLFITGICVFVVFAFLAARFNQERAEHNSSSTSITIRGKE